MYHKGVNIISFGLLLAILVSFSFVENTKEKRKNLSRAIHFKLKLTITEKKYIFQV